jgi:phenylacetate-coenzyme A ligase PaaK-like adenylate-forming protein
MDQASRDQMRIVKLSAWMDFGYTPASRLFLIWGHAHLLGTGWKGKFNHRKRKLADSFLGYQRVDAYRLDRASCVEYAEKLLRFRPLGLIGYTSALDLFARYTQQFRERFRALGLRFVLATAEPMQSPETQSLLEDLFGCPVVQEYGGAEFGQVAFKVGSAPFEVYSDLAYAECQAAEVDNPQAYPLLVTTLYPRYLPLFRYRVGDAIIGPERLPHGHVTRFAAVAGRLNDEIRLDDGASIHSVAIFHCIHQEPSVLNIQMMLKDADIEIRLVSTSPSDTSVETRVRKRLAQVHAQLGKARITFEEDVQTNRAGKRRWFVDARTKPQPSA